MMRTRLMNLTIALLAVISFILSSCLPGSDNEIPDFNVQLQKDIAAIDSYLAAKNITAQQDNSGIRYVLWQVVSTGEQPTIDSCVTANYQGLLMANGQEFDKGTNISFPLANVIEIGRAHV